MERTNGFDKAVGRLGWLEIIGITAIAAVAYATLLWQVEEHLGEYVRLIEAMGHIFITVGIILVVRKIEIPLVDQDRARSLKEIDDRYMNLVARHVPVVSVTSSLHLRNIYENRAAALPAVVSSINGTKNTLLMAGVALYEKLSVFERSARLKAIVQDNPKIDARFLLLNPHTTPAVIRAFLESDQRLRTRFLGSADEFTRSHLYQDVRRACLTFVEHGADRVFGTRVRFYQRDPSAWLVVTDDSVFYEPYTGGRPSSATLSDMRIGGHMPVFEFDRERSPVAAILMSHFERLWGITDDNLDELRRLFDHPASAAERLERDVFTPRRTSLQALDGMLTKAEQRVPSA